MWHFRATRNEYPWTMTMVMANIHNGKLWRSSSQRFVHVCFVYFRLCTLLLTTVSYFWSIVRQNWCKKGQNTISRKGFEAKPKKTILFLITTLQFYILIDSSLSFSTGSTTSPFTFTASQAAIGSRGYGDRREYSWHRVISLKPLFSLCHQYLC